MQHCVKDGDADLAQNFLPRDQDCRDCCGTDISVMKRTLYGIGVAMGEGFGDLVMERRERKRKGYRILVILNNSSTRTVLDGLLVVRRDEEKRPEILVLCMYDTAHGQAGASDYRHCMTSFLSSTPLQIYGTKAKKKRRNYENEVKMKKGSGWPHQD